MNPSIKSAFAKHRIWIFILVGIVIVVSLLGGVITTEIVRQLTSFIFNGQSIKKAAVFLVVTLFTTSIFRAAQTVITIICIKECSVSLENKMIQSILDYDYYNGVHENASNYFAQINSNAKNMADAYVNFWSIVLSTTIICISTGIYIGFLNFYILLANILLVVLYILALNKRGSKIAEAQKSYVDAENIIQSENWELINNREISGFLNHGLLFGQYQKKAKTTSDRLVTMCRTSFPYDMINLYGGTIIIIMVSIIGGAFCINGSMGISSLFAIILSVQSLNTAVLVIPSLIPKYNMMIGLNNKVSEVFTHTANEYKKPEHLFPEQINTITIKNLTFSYGQTPIYKNSNLVIQKGMINTLVGVSGTGKSTLLKLICNLNPYQEGKVIFEKTTDISRKSLWANISYVTQTPVLLPLSLKDNVIFGRDYEEQRFKKILESLGLDNMPNIESDVINLNKLSAGEKQKIAIARAFYSRKPIMLFDEPTSALDLVSEQKFISLLTEHIKTNMCIVLIVTHSEAIIHSSNRVIKLENGVLI